MSISELSDAKWKFLSKKLSKDFALNLNTNFTTFNQIHDKFAFKRNLSKAFQSLYRFFTTFFDFELYQVQHLQPLILSHR